MIKTFFKLALCVLLYAVVSSVVNSVLPFSPGFMELKSSFRNSFSLLFMALYAVWVCYTMYFIARRANIYGRKLYLSLVGVMFFVNSFMTQIETLLFGGAFPSLARSDWLKLMLAALVSIAAAALLIVVFFQNKNAAPVKWNIGVKNLIIKLGIIGIIYVCLYFLFGYFVAWQFKELRYFYTNSEVNNITQSYAWTPAGSQLVLAFIQILRGVLFGVFILPLRKMISAKSAFVISVCLVFLSTGMQLIIPNPLFPDIVRYAHLIEMTGSMLLFGLFTGVILWGKGPKTVKE